MITSISSSQATNAQLVTSHSRARSKRSKPIVLECPVCHRDYEKVGNRTTCGQVCSAERRENNKKAKNVS